MSDANKDDLANLCCHIHGSDLDQITEAFEGMGFHKRGFDRIPGVAHDGQAVSYVRHESHGEQIHVVLYRAGDGFDAAAHVEPDELTNAIAHIAMVLQGRSADYGAGTLRFQQALRWSGLSYTSTVH